MPKMHAESPVDEFAGLEGSPTMPEELSCPVGDRLERMGEQFDDLCDIVTELIEKVDRIATQARLMTYRQATAAPGEDPGQFYTLEDLTTRYKRTRQTIWLWQRDLSFPRPVAVGLWLREDVDKWDETYGTEEGRRVLSLIIKMKRLAARRAAAVE